MDMASSRRSGSVVAAPSTFPRERFIQCCTGWRKLVSFRAVGPRDKRGASAEFIRSRRRAAERLPTEGPCGAALLTRLAASWGKPTMPQPSPVADYLHELGRELAFDPSLSRR